MKGEEKMRKLITILGVCVLFITLSFSGCELLEEEPDYITVVVVADVLVSLLDNKGEFVVTDIAEGVPIQIMMIKDGGERTILNRVTDEAGTVTGATGTFKVYKEQPVECIATATGSYKTYAPVAPAFWILSWEEVDAAADFGGTYTWTVDLLIQLQQTQP